MWFTAGRSCSLCQHRQEFGASQVVVIFGSSFNRKYIPAVPPCTSCKCGISSELLQGSLCVGFWRPVENDFLDFEQIHLCPKCCCAHPLKSLGMQIQFKQVFVQVLGVGKVQGLGKHRDFASQKNIWQGILPTSGGGCCVWGLNPAQGGVWGRAWRTRRG